MTEVAHAGREEPASLIAELFMGPWRRGGSLGHRLPIGIRQPNLAQSVLSRWHGAVLPDRPADEGRAGSGGPKGGQRRGHPAATAASPVTLRGFIVAECRVHCRSL